MGPLNVYYTVSGGVGGGGHYLSVCKSAPTKYKPLYLILISPLTPVLDVRLKTRSCAGKGQFIRSYTPLANTLALESLVESVSSFLKAFCSWSQYYHHIIINLAK